MISIYTDGSAKTNGDPDSEGTYCYVVTSNGDFIYEYASHTKYTTNNRMEMSAFMMALLYAYNNHPNEAVNIISDSQMQPAADGGPSSTPGPCPRHPSRPPPS